MQKTVLSIILIVLTIALVVFSVWLWFHDGDKQGASYSMLWALTIHVIVRSYLG